MSDPVTELIQRGLALPQQDRARLAELLLLSLGDDATHEAAWADEIGRRLAAYDRGEVQAVDAAEVLAQAEAIVRGAR